jgi:phosphoribosylformylglycinamidine cyclo-ligase
MLDTFNCGLGLVIAVAASDAAQVRARLTATLGTVIEAGVVEAAPGAEASCVVSGAEKLWRG